MIFKNLKNEYEYFVVKSNCMVVFADMYPKLQVLSRKLPSLRPPALFRGWPTKRFWKNNPKIKENGFSLYSS